MKNLTNKKKIILGSIIGVLIGTLLSVSYAFYTYSRTGTTSQLVTGDIYMRYKEGTALDFTGAMPSSTYPDKSSGKYFQFQITGKNTNTEGDIAYKLNLVHGDDDKNGKQRIDDTYLYFRLVEVSNLGQNNETETIVADDINYATINNSLLYKTKIPKNTTNEITKTYRLYARISESVGIGTNTTYTIERWNNSYASIKINAEGEYAGPLNEKQLVTQLVQNNTVSGTTTKYIKGESNNNYVWYSGRMWRIVCYDEDTTTHEISNIKLVTQDTLTTLYYSSGSVNFKDSYVYTWLNEDFYDTLINQDNIIQPATWDDGSAEPISAPVGLLSNTDYLSAGSPSSYLNIRSKWWLITQNDSKVRRVSYNGSASSDPPASYSYGVRPSIYLKSGIEFTGSGTMDEPYMIKGDKEIGIIGDSLNLRTVGEYVRFKNTDFRIVGIENNNTKLVSVDNANISGTYFKKYFSSSKTFGLKRDTNNDDNYSDYYLNNTWLDSLGLTTEELRSNYLAIGTFYLGEYADGGNYKTTICVNNEDNLKKPINGTNSCEKLGTQYQYPNENSIENGYVGLLRVGEIFSSREGSGSGSSKNMWLITPNDTLVCNADSRGELNKNSPASSSIGVSPSIYLKSNIIISGGSGLKGDPYRVEIGN